MNSFVRLLLAVLLSMSVNSSLAQASAGGTLIKAMGRYLAKETGKEATEQAAKEMAKQVGEELIERTAQKVIAEGGEKSLLEVSELVAQHGPEVVRALDNAPNAVPLIKLLDELPAAEVGQAAARLGAGSAGRELATISSQLGTRALSAEVKHPGVGLKFAKALGSDGVDLSLKLTTDQAVQIGRHVDDIALLPPSERSQLVSMISSNTDRFAAFVGRFVENNPGKVLFTAATAPIILANSDAIFGDGQIEYGPDGKPILLANGQPVRTHPGLLPTAASDIGDTVKAPVQTTLYWLGGVVVILASLAGASKVWKFYQQDRLSVSKSDSK